MDATTYSDEQLELFAQISFSDIERAKHRWRSDAPTAYATLLDAEERSPDATG
jgi:hypothetical protein